MPDSSDQLDPKEATEAKLCAYLEGELSPVERAEIEQHLASNPQHRQLLADLAKTREWMRSIPSEMAPADLSEVFQQQVERAMLLDDSTSESRSSMNRWPQVVLVAAILSLTVGLGVVIFAMLRPPGSGKMFSLTKSPSSAPMSASTQPTEDRALALKTTHLDLPVLPLNVVATPAPMAAGVGSEHFAIAGAVTESQPAAVIDKPLPPSRDLSDISSADGVKAKLLSAGYHLPADQKTVGFVVSTDSTDATVNQVREFFARHDLAFDDALTGKHESVAVAQSPAITLPALATTTPTSAPSETIYVAQRLTPLQLELLSANLSTDNLNQTAKRFTLSEAPTTAPMQDATGAIAKGQMLSVTIPQLVGPGIEKTNMAKVADDGTISLPMIDPLPAAGTSPTELQQRIAAKYREANLIPRATVIVSLPATTQATTVPTSQPLVKVLAVTQPTTVPTTQIVRDDPGITVVVLIENSKTP